MIDISWDRVNRKDPVIHIERIAATLTVRIVLLLFLLPLLVMGWCLPKKIQAGVDFVKTGENLLRNGDLSTLSEDGFPRGWSASGALTAKPDRQGQGAAAQSLRLKVPGERRASLVQEVEVRSKQEYLFSVWVKSDGRVVARAGQLSMSYNDQGNWQQLVGLVRIGKEDRVRLSLELSGLDGAPFDGWLQSASLRAVARPAEAVYRSRHGKTVLVAQGQSSVTIIYPSSVAAGKVLADQIQTVITRHSGVEIRVVSDVEATETDTPVLKEVYRQSHLILLGRLGTNRAMWVGYNRFLCAADGYYPGSEGYVVRTAANVLRNGKNHLIIGSSSDDGLKQAVSRFIMHLNSAAITEKGSLTLPWLLDVKLSGPCLEALQDQDNRWREDPHHPLLPRVEAGYGTIRRWYENAMGYYWTGWESYRQRAVDYLEPVLTDRASTHHYLVEFLVRCYDMLDDSDLFTDSQRREMDHLILTNFLGFLSGPDLRWMTTFSPPYEHIVLNNRHQVAPWMSDRIMAEFLEDYCDLGDELAKLVRFRREEKQRVMAHLIGHRWEVSLPPPTPSAVEEILASMFRFALHHEQYHFFEQGHARRALQLAKINHVTGQFVKPVGRLDHHLVLGMLAHYYQDGRYRWLLENLDLVLHPTGSFQGRYVAGVRRYMPGPELNLQSLEGWGGVRVPPMTQHNQDRLSGLHGRLWKKTEISPAQGMDVATLRGGFEPDNDYVSINGAAGPYPPGVFIDFTSRGQSWFGITGPSSFSPTSERYFDHNAVTVVRFDRWLQNEKAYPAVARRQWVADLYRCGGISFELSPFMDTRWNRQVIWVQSGLYVVRDTVTALEDGRYQMTVNWRPEGWPSWNGRTWTSIVKGKQLHMTPLGRYFKVQQNVEAFASQQEDQLYFRQVASRYLRSGESATAVTVIQAIGPEDHPAYQAHLINDSTVQLKSDKASILPITIRWDGFDENGIRTDAAVTVSLPNRFLMLNGHRLETHGQVALASARPVNMAIDWFGRQLWMSHDNEPPVRYPLDATMTRNSLVPQQQASIMQLEPDRLSAQVLAGTQAISTDKQQEVPLDPQSEEHLHNFELVDVGSQWQEAWSYTGLQRPAEVRRKQRIGKNMVDLGSVVRLVEIKPVQRYTGPWQPTRLPDEIWAALPGENGQAPQPDSENWQQLPQPQWQAGFRGGNYGRGDPIDRSYQVIKSNNVRARFIRGENVHGLRYYNANKLEAREPLRLEVEDMDADGVPEVFIASDVSRAWPRRSVGEDGSFAMLTDQGEEIFQYDEPVNIQSLRLLDYHNNGKKQVFLTTRDSQIRIFERDGTLAKHFDLYQMHQDFQKRFGRENTRQPAGGYTTPFGLGLWRAGSSGTNRIVVARYGCFSFIDPQGQFEGLLRSVGYAMRGLLPYGIDFDRDGLEEQIALERYRIIHLEGEAKPYVPDPEGREFYPQVYESSFLTQPDSPLELAGSPVRVFEALSWKNDSIPRYVLVIREGFLGIYDGQKRSWEFTWVPLTPLSAATLVAAGSESLCVYAVTGDNLMWKLQWHRDLAKLHDFQVYSLPIQVSQMRGTGNDRVVVVAGRDGLYLLDQDFRLSQLHSGSFYDAHPLTFDARGLQSIVGSLHGGRVICLEQLPKNQQQK